MNKFLHLVCRRFHAPTYATLLLVLFLLSNCQSEDDSSLVKPIFPDSTTHYRVEAQIRPDSGFFDVSVGMRFVPDKPTDTLRFLLHDSLQIKSITGPALGRYSFRSWRFGEKDTVHTRVITIPLARTATPSKPVTLSWKYAGRLLKEQIPGIGGAIVTPHWTELPLESMWMPVRIPIGHQFTFEASVNVPRNHKLVSTGSLRKTSSGWHIQSTVPGPDIPLVISDRMKVRKYSSGAIPVTVYHGGAPDSVISFVAKRAGQILDHYAGRFQGRSETDELRITVAPVDRALSSSYARTGFIALKHGIKPDTSLYGLIAHEAAHLWWNDAVNPLSRHNFLNESFAEYESWVALRNAYGKSVFQEQLAEARKRAEKAPGFNEWTPQLDGKLSYNKGPVLLHQLHQRIGDTKFQSFEIALQQKEAGTIGSMLKTLEKVTEPKTARWFRKKLMN